MKLGLVLEGGASRAYFSAGVMDFLLEKNINADYIVGVSAGIANAVSYVSKQSGRNIEIADKYIADKRYMGIHHLINPKKRSFYNIDFVFGEIPEKYVPFDYETFANSKSETVAVVTNIKTGEAEHIKVGSYDRSWKTIIASCALPILFKPVEIDGKLYMDGGIVDPVPVDKALEVGCDKIIVITTRECEYRKKKEIGVKLSALMYRKYPKLEKLLKDRVKNYNNSRKKLVELKERGEIFLISPDNTNNWGRTDSNPEKIRYIYNRGYETVEKILPELLEYLNKK